MKAKKSTSAPSIKTRCRAYGRSYSFTLNPKDATKQKQSASWVVIRGNKLFKIWIWMFEGTFMDKGVVYCYSSRQTDFSKPEEEHNLTFRFHNV